MVISDMVISDTIISDTVISNMVISDMVISDGVITPNQIPLTTIVTYLQKNYRSRISNHWATIPACSVIPPIYKKSKKTYCHVSF